MQSYNRGVVGDTLITMWDLSQKPISQLKVEDEILAYDEANEEPRNEKPYTVDIDGEWDPNGKVAQGWTPGVGFDCSHTGYNAHSKGVIKKIEKSVVSKVIKVTFGNDPEETIGDYDDFSIIMTPDNLIQMSHDVGFECGDACPHISWKSYDLEFNDILKLDMGQLSVGDLGYRTPNEYEPLPKDFHGPPDYLDEMRIDDIEELEGEFEVYHIIEAESATMMFANNTILHVGIN